MKRGLFIVPYDGITQQVQRVCENHISAALAAPRQLNYIKFTSNSKGINNLDIFMFF